MKGRIDKKQQNSKCRLCCDRDETINHIISECRKLAQKDYKTRQDWVGKVILLVIVQEIESWPYEKWYMHNSTSVLENNTEKLFWDLTSKQIT